MSILNFMGNTPLVRLENPYGANNGQVFIKLEEFNPGGSIKSRVGLQMIEDAEICKKIKKGDILLEPTGGNTGIGLALAASIKGYKLKLTIPDNFSQEKISVLEKLGVDVILADHNNGNDCHILKAQELMLQYPDYICLNQFSNLSNPRAHYYGTGKEIISQMQNQIDYFVASIGSGGTIMGVGKRLKEYIPEVNVIGVQPKGCDLINNVYIPHEIQSTAVGKVGEFVDFNFIDSMVCVDIEEVQEMREYLAKRQGLFLGISSVANVVAALHLSKQVSRHVNIVTVAPDSGRSYLQY